MSSGVLVNSNIAKVELNVRAYAVLHSVLHGVALAIFVYLSLCCGCSDFFMNWVVQLYKFFLSSERSEFSK